MKRNNNVSIILIHICHPGQMFDDVDRLQQQFPDVFSCFLPDMFDLSQTGTLFRLPLRTKHMAQTSKLIESPKEVTASDIFKLFKSFAGELTNCLLFLKNVTTTSTCKVQTFHFAKND